MVVMHVGMSFVSQRTGFESCQNQKWALFFPLVLFFFWKLFLGQRSGEKERENTFSPSTSRTHLPLFFSYFFLLSFKKKKEKLENPRVRGEGRAPAREWEFGGKRLWRKHFLDFRVSKLGFDEWKMSRD